MPFGKLVEKVDILGTVQPHITLGEMAKALGEPTERVMDAIDAVKMLRGETP